MSELLELVWGKPQVDPVALSQAIEQELQPGNGNLDYRTRLLIRDSTVALEHYWGKQRLQQWLNSSPVRAKIEAICHEHFDKVGFPSLEHKLMDRTEIETVKEFLRELGSKVDKSVTLEIGGSIALILMDYLSRATEDIDVADQIPDAIRSNHKLLEDLQKNYGLLLTHFQSHYLPSGWKSRLHDLGSFGLVSVHAVDVYDIFIGKLFSKREKDLADLRMIKPKIKKDHLVKQFFSTTASLLKDKPLKQAAEKNWYILFGENLPS